jgi:hypothetical protein
MADLQVVSSSPQNQTMAGQVFWRGADGNVYVRAGDSVTNAGSGAETWNYILNGATEIADPNPGNPQQSGTTDLSGGGGGSSAPTYKDTTASRNATQVSLDNVDTIFNNAITGADTDYTNIKTQYDTEDAANLQKYQGDVEGNEIDRDGNTQAALRTAAQGARGLYATLASLGALGGTGRTLANRAVASEANTDLGEGEKSFKTNVETLFDARGEVEKKEKQRRLDAEQTWKDARNNAEYDKIAQNQKLSQEMAGYWQDAGNFGEANNWINRASGYTPELAAKTKKAPAQYATTPLEYGAPALNKYLGGMNSTAVNVASGNPVNGALYTSTSPRKEKELV